MTAFTVPSGYSQMYYKNLNSTYEDLEIAPYSLDEFVRIPDIIDNSIILPAENILYFIKLSDKLYSITCQTLTTENKFDCVATVGHHSKQGGFFSGCYLKEGPWIDVPFYVRNNPECSRFRMFANHFYTYWGNINEEEIIKKINNSHDWKEGYSCECMKVPSSLQKNLKFKMSAYQNKNNLYIRNFSERNIIHNTVKSVSRAIEGDDY